MLAGGVQRNPKFTEQTQDYNCICILRVTCLKVTSKVRQCIEPCHNNLLCNFPEFDLNVNYFKLKLYKISCSCARTSLYVVESTTSLCSQYELLQCVDSVLG